MTEAESAQHWYQKYCIEKEENKKLNWSLGKWKEQAGAQSDRAEMEAKKFAREKGHLEKLRASHVRAVNSTGNGLEPVSDQRFVERLRELHHDVCRVQVWRRMRLIEW